MQILTGFNQEKTSCKKAKIQSKLMSTEICKNRPLVTSEMSAQSLIAARSYPSFQNLKKTTQTENKKSEKEKFVKFEDEIFTNKKFSSIKRYHSKTEPCPMLWGLKNIRDPTNICSTKEGRTQKLVKIKKLKTKKMLMDSVNSNLPHPENVHITTRTLSSKMGEVFDPIGLLAPVTLQCKFLFQHGNMKLDGMTMMLGQP